MTGAGASGSFASRTAAPGAVGLALASALAWICCLPIATGAFGIALAAIAAAVSPWWPLLAAGSLLLLIVTIVQTLRGTGGTGSCEIEGRQRRQWLFVGAISAVTLGLLTLPWWSAALTYRMIR